MAPNALKDLDMAVLLFQKAAPQSQRAKVALAVLKRLQDKATKVFAANSAGDSPLSPITDLGGEPSGDVDLAIFGGQARVLTKKPKNHRNSVSERRCATGSPASATGGRTSSEEPMPGGHVSSSVVQQAQAPAAVINVRMPPQPVAPTHVPPPPLHPDPAPPLSLPHEHVAALSASTTTTQHHHGPKPSLSLDIEIDAPSPFSYFSGPHSISAAASTSKKAMGGEAPRQPATEAQYKEFLDLLGTTPKGHLSVNPARSQPVAHSPVQQRGRERGLSLSSNQNQIRQPAVGVNNAWDNPWSSWDPIPAAESYLAASSAGRQMATGSSSSQGEWPAGGTTHVSSSHASGSGYHHQGASQLNTLSTEQYDLRENEALLASFGLLPASSSSTQHQQQQREGELGGEGEDRDDMEGVVIGQLRNPGAVELGLSGESRLDTNWLAFMQDCGILESGDPSMLT